VNSNAPGFDVDIEEHQDTVRWILTFKDALPNDTLIKGQLDGQVCQSGEGGLCIPITVAFEAKYDADLQTDTAGVAERFVWRNKENVPSPAALSPVEVGGVSSLSSALLYAFLGGIILNFMPCVLPVIGLKVLSFFEQAGHSRTRALLLNVAYSLGLLSVFLVLAFFSLGLSILFTFDVFNIVMACIVFAMALSLMNIWELSVPAFLGRGKSAELMQREGVVGAFGKGIITTLLAIPCGAPLLSPAVNWSDLQIRNGNTAAVFVMYAVIGLGMASPYLIAGAFPECLRFLPKAGRWMETFRNIMGFCLLFAVIWILYFIPLEKLLPTVAVLFAVWFACWILGRNQMAGKVRAADYIAGLLVLAVVLMFSFELPQVPNRYTLESAMQYRLHGNQDGHWQPYSKAAFDKALASGKTVAVDFTADWCMNCKVLEATVLESPEVLQVLDEQNIVSLTADCTRSGEATDLLLQLGPRQVPVLAVFDPKQPEQPVVLRGGYTVKTFISLLLR
ncbi:MAG: thioredoxin family protein, partial [Planctomycetaceae bacterium]|nr:thioredoxin family protein [Planctomycetaceae bacterium]